MTPNAFSPMNKTINAGERLIWWNSTNGHHTVTSDTGNELEGDLTRGDTYGHTFDNPGTYAYHCDFHSSMHGTITVQ